MYSDEDINSAVAAGAFSAEAAARLRAHVSAARELPRVDEENFRLVSSFNDIFVTIGVVILLITAGNLIPRAVQTHRWYREKFADYPADRKALVPFLI